MTNNALYSRIEEKCHPNPYSSLFLGHDESSKNHEEVSITLIDPYGIVSVQ